jgi:hypothetical protein
MCSLLPHHGDTRVAVKIIIAVLSAMIDQEILFLIDKLQNIPLARLEMRGQLNGKRRTRLLTKTAVDTAGKIDTKPSGIAAPVLTLGRLHGDATDRTDRRAKIAGHTALFTVWITGEDDDGPGPCGQGPFILRILLGDGLSKKNLQRRRKPFH